MSNVPTEVTQIDVMLAEDGKTVIMTGHTRDIDRSFIASFMLPESIDEEGLDRQASLARAPTLRWRMA